MQFNLSKSASSSSSSLSSAVPSGVLSSPPSSLELLFIEFVRRYGRVYSAADFSVRFSIFSANVAVMDAHNAEQTSSHRLGITEHADWTEAEFRQYRLGYRRPSKALLSDASCNTALYANAVATDSVDWRESSAVSGVKNQGSTQHTPPAHVHRSSTASTAPHSTKSLSLQSICNQPVIAPTVCCFCRLCGLLRAMWSVLVVRRHWQCGGFVGYPQQRAPIAERAAAVGLQRHGRQSGLLGRLHVISAAVHSRQRRNLQRDRVHIRRLPRSNTAHTNTATQAVQHAVTHIGAQLSQLPSFVLC